MKRKKNTDQLSPLEVEIMQVNAEHRIPVLATFSAADK